jgi:hypothetical protein
MESKFIIRIIAIAIFFVVLISVFIYREESIKRRLVSVSNNTLFIKIDGYVKSCLDRPSLFIKEGIFSWKKVNRNLPPKGMYYLDGEYHGYGMCDVVRCSKIQIPYTIQLVEYKKIGMKEPLETLEIKDYKVPVYQTVILKGKIKVELKYYTDDKCKNKKIFTTIIEN